MDNLMYTPLENIFKATMEREGKTVVAVTSGSEFQAFFRRCDDGQSAEDRITIYYDVDAPIEQGSLISYGRKTYILMNKETEENTCYYKSYGIACNGILNSNNGTVRNVPVYGYDLQNGIAYSGQVVTVISGNMEFITENNEMTKQLDINNTFNVYGRTFKIDNIYYKDGMTHIVTQVTLNESDPTPPEPEEPEGIATIEASTNTIKVGGSYKTLTMKVCDDGENDITDNYSDSAFVWTCSIDGVDYTESPDVITWLNGTKFNQKKIKFCDNRSYLQKILKVKCTINDTITATLDLSISV